MQFHDNLEIPGGNTRRQIKVEVRLGYCSVEDKCLNLHEKWNQGEIWSEPCPQIQDELITRGPLLIQETSMIDSTSDPWA